jgi:membrane protease YdiL (CAAX protease family)
MRRGSAGSLVAFFLLTYALMWACFGTVAAARIPANSVLGFLLITLGVFAPSLVALALTARAEGRAGVRALLGRIVQGPVAARWYIFAVAYIPAIKLAAAAIQRVATGAWPRFGDVPLYLIPLAILVSTPVQAGEEVGWRGYALPRMAERMGLARASVLLGLLWAFWHLPQFFIPEADTYGQSFLVYVLQVTALSVAMAWLFAKAGGSLLPVMLMHAAVNNAKDIVPSATPGASDPFGSSASLVAWLTVTLLWICAGVFLARMPRTTPGFPTGSRASSRQLP